MRWWEPWRKIPPWPRGTSYEFLKARRSRSVHVFVYLHDALASLLYDQIALLSTIKYTFTNPYSSNQGWATQKYFPSNRCRYSKLFMKSYTVKKCNRGNWQSGDLTNRQCLISLSRMLFHSLLGQSRDPTYVRKWRESGRETSWNK